VTLVPSAADVESWLVQRLRAVGPLLHPGPLPAPDATPALDAGTLLEVLVGSVRSDPGPDRLWLLLTALSGAFPTVDEVMAAVRLFRLASNIEATIWALALALEPQGATVGNGELQVVTHRVVVDVDHSARHELHTGIQQVVRRTLPIWKRDHDVAMAVWTDGRLCYRPPTSRETDRALRRDDGRREDPAVAALLPLLVPWRTVVVLAETPPREACERLAALAQLSGNAVVAIGYDCIPVVSADLVPAGEPGRFARYLSIIKHARRVAGISTSATVEFLGFAHALPAQGLAGPAVIECALPSESVAVASAPVPASPAPTGADDGPMILSVGSLEPRKNHLALLYAAERLWREGRQFRLRLIGRSGWGDDVSSRVDELRAVGRPVDIRSAVSDLELLAAYQAARFTVFPSLHEGYGLPVAESLSAGTPVITGDYGSTKEIGAAGGVMLIDPRDDEMLVDAVRTLLTDDERLRRLQAEIAQRPTRSWEDYAAELWDGLVGPSLGLGEEGP
jgi:glycosyltransferase involved in cell wall biosynthesis